MSPVPPPLLIDAGPSTRGAHFYELFNRCPQLWSWFHHPQWRIPRLLLPDDQRLMVEGAPLDSGLTATEALVRGTLIHVALAHHYKRLWCIQVGVRPDAYYAPMDALDAKAAKWAADGDDLSASIAHKVLPVCRDIVGAYFMERQFEELEVLHVEEEFRGRVRNRLGGEDYLYTMRGDLVYRAEGRVWIEDHKSVWKIDERIPLRYSHSLQFLGQQWFGHKLFGADFGGVRLNLLCTRPDSRGPMFKRIPLPPAPKMLERFPKIIQDAEERKQVLLNAGVPAEQFPRAASEQVCMTPYGPCPGQELCAWGPE